MGKYTALCYAILGLTEEMVFKLRERVKMGQIRAQSQGMDMGMKIRSNRRDLVNRRDIRFIRQEERIRRGLENALAKRRINLKTSELCREVKIASPTFYLHYKDCGEALVQYELSLEEEFVRRLARNGRRESGRREITRQDGMGQDSMRQDLGFTILMSFVEKHRHYFSAAFRSRDMYLIGRLIRYTCEAEAKLNRKPYELYVWAVGAMIWCWGECDKFSVVKMETYQKKLRLLRVMDYGV